MAVLKILRIIFVIFWNVAKTIVEWLTPSFLKKRKSIAGQLALVTGGGSGLGRELSLRLASLGADVVIWDVDADGAEDTRKMILEMGQRAYVYHCDVSDRAEVYRRAQQVKDQVGKVDILVNNAGVGIAKMLTDAADEKVESIFGINIVAHFWTCGAFLPDMIQENKGHVVAISSLAGMFYCPYLTHYAATKHAVLAFMGSLQMEMILKGTEKVGFTTACPSFMKTNMLDRDAELPFIETERVALEVIDAMLLDRDLVVVPRYAYWFLVLLRIFPSPKVVLQIFLQFKGPGYAFLVNEAKLGGIDKVIACKQAYQDKVQKGESVSH